MPRITYIEANGTEHVVDAAEGVSAMEAAVSNGVPGIDGDCGGSAACGTCHVFVDSGWIDRLGKADAETEVPMLELSDDFRDDSRLSCMIRLTDAHDGLILRMPEAQF